MEIQHLFLSLTSLLCLSILLFPHSTVGICYGRVASNLPPPSNTVELVKSNGIATVRLFNTDPETLTAFSGSGISLMIGIPNEILPSLANGPVDSSLHWLQSNLFSHVPPNQIRYITVGNEILLKDTFYNAYLVPAMQNMYKALQTLNLADTIKLSSAHAASILSNSYPPSAGAFDPNFLPIMIPLLQFLRDTQSPLMVNVYPYFSYVNNPQDVSLDSVLFRSTNITNDQNMAYDNVFDMTVDAFVYAMEREGFAGIPVVVTETGWPTGGGAAASDENALAYNGNVVRRALENVGTPRKPGVGVEVFLFDLFDENEKDGEESEKHFGVFGVDGVKTYPLNFN
ncbi:hypothetical protein RHMOL_Rhmol12G0048900 [Rhododendron molle]|uniref:Uncharacterized protein n=1 Tax=Rhododendron molle TaxID=49168 RepID=A0ACC0LFN5_RHOML|nr:hypothetical protein RHMOL_Rhmol12G0048900 [Rhododendron molle]